MKPKPVRKYGQPSRLCHSPISRLAAVLLVALALSSLASCGRKPDTTAGGGSGSGEIRVAAAKRGDLGKVKALLKGNPDFVFSKDTNGWTPLHFAAAKGQKDVALLLLAHKAEVNAKTSEGETPLHWAVGWGHKEVAALLLANKAEVNTKDKDGKTPFQLATDKGRKDVAELLRHHGGHE